MDFFIHFFNGHAIKGKGFKGLANKEKIFFLRRPKSQRPLSWEGGGVKALMARPLQKELYFPSLVSGLPLFQERDMIKPLFFCLFFTLVQLLPVFRKIMKNSRKSTFFGEIYLIFFCILFMT